MNRDEQNRKADESINEFLPQILKQGFITICYGREGLLFLNFEYYKNGKILKAQSQKGYRHLLLLLCADIFKNKSIKDGAKDLFPYSFSADIPDEERFFKNLLVTVELKKSQICIEVIFLGERNGIIGQYQSQVFNNTFLGGLTDLRQQKT